MQESAQTPDSANNGNMHKNTELSIAIARTKRDPRFMTWLADELQRTERLRKSLSISADSCVEHIALHAASLSPEGISFGIAVDDLILAKAAVLGNRVAIARVECLLQEVASRVFQRTRLHGYHRDDLMQEMRRLLFMGTTNGIPKLLTYSGKGRLQSWLQIVLRRETQRLAIRDEKRRRILECHNGEAPPNDLEFALKGPESDLIADQQRRIFVNAFRAAVASLDIKDRRFLRNWLKVGSTAQAARSMHKGRATLFRQMSRIRKSLLRLTRLNLQKDAGLPASQVSSLLASLRGRLELALTTVLKTEITGSTDVESALTKPRKANEARRELP